MIRYATHTQAGAIHGENQDRVGVDPRHGTFVVADGVGGLADAAATAQTVVDQLPGRILEQAQVLAGPEIVSSVSGVTAGLNEQVRRTARCGPGTTGATTALLLIRGSTALVVHLGDSRVYLARGDRLSRLTTDHELPGGQLTRFVGMAGVVEPGVSLQQLRTGDRLLLCTDGLTSGVDDAALRELLVGTRDLDSACRQLVDAARASGAMDDISVILVEYGTAELR